MFVNNTKTTLPVFRVAIAYNDEKGFEIISKIIQLFRWLKVNVIFEPIEIAGKNYQKQMIYGIDEDNLSRLKRTNLLLHTPFDYSFFDKNVQFNVEKYLHTALQNCFIKTFFKLEDNKERKIEIFETDFFSKNKQYIANINNYDEYVNSASEKLDIEYLKKMDYYYSFGGKFAIFALNNFKDNAVMSFVIELMNFLKLKTQSILLNDFENLDDAIIHLKRNNENVFLSVKLQELDVIPNISWKDVDTKIPSKIFEEETLFVGKFQINNLVSLIKEGQIKLPENYELYQILQNGIEYYPNINFWEYVVIDPTLKLKQKDD